jgi:hypothetical protein
LIDDKEEAIEVCCDKMYCHGCAVPLTPAMKRYVDETFTPLALPGL